MGSSGIIFSVLIFLSMMVSAQSPIPIGEEFQINSASSGLLRNAAIGRDGSGNMVVIWASESSSETDTDGWRLQGRRMSVTGEGLGTEFQVNGITVGDQNRPVIGQTGDGFTVVWQSNSLGEGYDIHLRRFTSSGTPVGPEFRVNEIITGDQLHPGLEVQDTGDFLVVWQSEGSRGDDTSEESIQGRRFDSLGAAIGSPFQINSLTVGYQGRPKLASVGAEGFVVVWQSESKAQPAVQGQLLDRDGQRVGEEFRVESDFGGPAVHPLVDSDGTGGFVVIWGDGIMVWGQRFSSLGNTVGEKFIVGGGVFAGGPLTLDDDGDRGFIVTYSAIGNIPPRPGFGGKRYTPYSPDPPGSFHLDMNHSHGVDAGVSETGEYWMIAPSHRNLYGQRFDVDGVLEEPFLCTPDDRTLCLQNGRFEVTAIWRDYQEETGYGRVVPGASGDSGLLWFFDEDNWEMLVKVLDGCPLNERFWVFAAATTDVDYTLRVRDSWTGESVAYQNALGTASPTITDTDAFATCP